MKTLIASTLVITVLAAAAVGSAARAAEPFDPAARARTIAPFLDEQTVAVARVDLTRVDIGPLADLLAHLAPDKKESMADYKSRLGAAIAALTRAGAKDLYAVVAFGQPYFFPNWPIETYLVVPLAAGADEKAIRAALPYPDDVKLRIADALVLAHPVRLHRLRQVRGDLRPELLAAFTAAGDTTVQGLLIPPADSRRVIGETLPELPPVLGGGPSATLVRGCLWAALGIDLPPKLAVRLVVQSQDRQAAEALRAAWPKLAGAVAKLPVVQSFLPQTDRIAIFLPPDVERDRLVRSVNADTAGAAAALALVATPLKQTWERMVRIQSTENLKRIGHAVHLYHDAHNAFPTPASYGPDGKPLLSWRVLILPYLGPAEKDLFGQFHPNEAWDSEHNRTLIEKMPGVFRAPISNLREKGRTTYVVPMGPVTAFPGAKGVRFQDITDGTSNTVMAMEVDDRHAVVWSKPDDLVFDATHPEAGLGGAYERGFLTVFCDGAVHFLPLPMEATELRAMFTRAGGEPVQVPR